MKLIKLLCVVLLGTVSTSLYAQTYVVVGKNGKVFDEANTKYVTLNQNNEEVTVIPGMVFKSTEQTPGWAKIEYSPGLHAFVPENILTSELSTPVAGNFQVKNNSSQQLQAIQDGDRWKATVDGKSYSGKAFGNIVVFFDNSNNPAYSLVSPGGETIVITYDNNVTNFF